MDDTGLRHAIIKALDDASSIDAARIGVAVENGIVTLTGRVGSSAEKAVVEHAVQRIEGVRALVQAIEVVEPRDRGRGDFDIARRALVAITWHVGASEITVHVEKGRVTLAGSVGETYQRRMAEAAVRKLDGVVGVSNLIETSPPESPSHGVPAAGARQPSQRLDTEIERHASEIGPRAALRRMLSRAEPTPDRVPGVPRHGRTTESPDSDRSGPPVCARARHLAPSGPVGL